MGATFPTYKTLFLLNSNIRCQITYSKSYQNFAKSISGPLKYTSVDESCFKIDLTKVKMQFLKGIFIIGLKMALFLMLQRSTYWKKNISRIMTNFVLNGKIPILLEQRKLKSWAETEIKHVWRFLKMKHLKY